jgi:hypothetical protein
MTDAPGIPRRSSEINLSWLNQVLSPPTPIVNYQSDIIGGGAGVLGELSRVKLTYAEGEPGPASVVAKFASPVPEARQLAGGLGLYEMESRFYAEINDQVGITIPTCYFNSFDAETQYSTLLLSDVQGKVADQVEGCSADQAAVALRNIARVHAYGTVAISQNPWLREWTEPAWIAFAKASLEANAPVSMDRMSDVCPPWLVDLAPTLHDHFADLAAQLMACGQTMIHGDLRADNLVFNASGEMTLLDWQLVFRAPGAFDVAYLLTQSLTIEDRRQHETELIGEYRSVLESQGGLFDQELFERAFRIATLSCLAYPLQAGAVIDENFERSQLLATAMLTRSCAAIEDYHCLDLL